MSALERARAEARAEWLAMPITYPFPLGDGSFARFTVPREITVQDAERVGEFLRSLVPAAVEGDEAA